MHVLRAQQFPSLIWLTFCTTANHAVCLTFCVLDAGGPIMLLRDRELVSCCNFVLASFGAPLVDRGWGCPSKLVLKSDGPIAFGSRSEVSWLVQVWFWAVLGALSVVWRLCGGGSGMIFRKGVLRIWLSIGVEDWIFLYKGVLLGWVVAMGVMDFIFR